jgi:folate-binding protein YgfZ
MVTQTLRIAARPRAFVAATGPDAARHLQSMLSNDVEALAVGESCPALLLTAKARLIAPLVVWRRGEEDFLLLTEPELGEAVRVQLVRMRLRAKTEVEPEQHTSSVVFGGEGGIPSAEFGEPAVEVLDSELAPTLDDEELERRRIEAGRPRWGRELDDAILPAEAGLTATHVSFTKGCYPGQEPIARLHYRGHANRMLRVLDVESAKPGDEVVYAGKVVGRVTSAVPGVALGYIRVEVPEEAPLEIGGIPARLHLAAPSRP